MIRWLGMALHHLRYIGISYRRNSTAAFFGMVFPLIILTVNGLIFGRGRLMQHGEVTTVASFYVAGMAIFAVVMICFTNLAVGVLFDRDMGRLKRIRGTPTPVSAYVAARLFFAVLMGLFVSLLCVAEGMALFGVHVTPERLGEFLLCVVIGSASLAGLSLAVVSLVPNAQAGPAVLNAVTFPILFVSSVFFPIDKLPPWLNSITGALPIRPLATAAVRAFVGGGLDWAALATVIAWGAGGALVAARTFRWQPRR
jgi:ABC-2 type transport system permease protein